MRTDRQLGWICLYRREPLINACPHAKKWNAEAAQKALKETHRVAALQPFGNRQGYETVPFVY